MDKELIKIDDLIRQRLGGVEERERPGGWASMRELLDKEMPQVASPATGGGNSRIWRYTVGLLLLSSAVAGGYAVLNRPGAADGAPTAFQAQTTGEATTSNTVNTILPSNTSSTPVATSDRNNASSAVAPASLQVASAGNPGTPRRIVQPSVQEVGFKRKAEQAPVTTAVSTAPVVAAENHRAGNGHNLEAIPTSPGRSNSGSGNTEAGKTPAGNLSGSATEIASLPLRAGAMTSEVGRNIPSVQPAQPKNLTLVRDTIRQMRIVSHTKVDAIRRTVQVYSDTQALQVLALEKWVLSDLTQPVPAELSTEGLSRRAAKKLRRQWAAKQPKTYVPPTVAAVAPKPAQAENQGISFPIVDAAATRTNTEVKLVPLSASRVDSRRTGIPWSPSEQFQSLVRNARTQLAQTKYYMGLIAGINSTVAGAGSLSGFHFGVTGLIALNERFALAAELKYFQRFNYSSILRDDYYTTRRVVDQGFASNGQAYNVYRFDRDSNTHSFKFSNMASLELPLSARYTIDRFSLLAGVNLGYHFRVDAEEGGVKYGTINRYDTVLASQPAPLPVSRAAEVSFDDFRARFSVGYLVGATYQLSPAVSLDLRMAQQLWNTHNNTPGARTVSKTYYQLPNLQLSVGYRFQQQPKQPRQ